MSLAHARRRVVRTRALVARSRPRPRPRPRAARALFLLLALGAGISACAAGPTAPRVPDAASAAAKDPARGKPVPDDSTVTTMCGHTQGWGC